MQRHKNPQAAGDIPGLLESLDAANKEIEEKQRDIARLELRAPIDGWVIPPKPVPEPQADNNEKLAIRRSCKPT